MPLFPKKPVSENAPNEKTVKSKPDSKNVKKSRQGKDAPQKQTPKKSAPHKARDKVEQKPKKNPKLEEQLHKAIGDYNLTHAGISNHGTALFLLRQRSVDLLDYVESLINSIANHPKSFDAVITEIQIQRKEFTDECAFAQKELEMATKSALGAGAGAAGGIAVASLAPTTAMWIATTFGTASTGTAISTLSGAVATKATLAWLGGGALAAGGGGVAAGQALLALAGPIGWGIAGASLLTSIVLFSTSKLKQAGKMKEEIADIKKNTESLKETVQIISEYEQLTEQLREQLSKQYISSLPLFGNHFIDLPDDAQDQLGALINNAKALAVTLGKEVQLN